MSALSLTPERLSRLRSLAWDLGFDHCSAASAMIPERDQSAYNAWISDGLAADLAYMTRDPWKRLEPARAYPSVRSVLTLGVSYFQGPFPEKPGAAYGRVARYAWGLDYHDIILERLNRFVIALRDILGDGDAVPAVDSRPVLERALASASSLGFVGKNTVLIMPRSSGVRFHVGSWVFLSEIFLESELEIPTVEPVAGGCGSCTRCLDACPTEAFERPYRLKADRCIAYLTIENKGAISLGMRERMGDWIFGCDVCQDVCPFNAQAFETRWPELKADRGAGPWLNLRELFSLKDTPAFKARWGSTPLSRAKRKGLVRNACVVAGNSGDESLVPDLEGLITDPEPLIRGHAFWALTRLSPSASFRAARALELDEAPEVRSEIDVYRGVLPSEMPS